MMKTQTTSFLFAAVIALSGACGGDDIPGDGDGDGDGDCVAATWTAPNFATNAATEIDVRTQIDALAGGDSPMRGAEQETATVDELSDLTALYDSGATPISSIVGAEFDAILQLAFADFVAAMNEGQEDLYDEAGQQWNPNAVTGGIYNVRGINAGGIELRQIADKGLYAAALYRHALSLTEGTIDAATVDQIAAAWGADATLDSENRTDAANYSFAMGFYGTISAALAEAKSFAGDPSCSAELDAAIRTVFTNWEQALYARTLFYANAGADEMPAADSADEDARVGALHEYAEGLGLALGFYGIPAASAGPLAGAGRTITDAEIEALMDDLGIPDLTDLSAAVLGTGFTVTPASMASAASDAEATLMSVFGFTTAQIESFRTPTEG